MNKIVKFTLAQIMISLSYIIVWFILNSANSFQNAGSVYLQAFAIFNNYIGLLIVFNEKDIEKDDLRIWIVSSIISVLVAFVIMLGYKKFINAFIFAIQIYGISLAVALGYRIKKNGTLFKFYEKLICLAVAVLSPYIYWCIAKYIPIAPWLFSILPMYSVVLYYYFVLKKKKIL